MNELGETIGETLEGVFGHPLIGLTVQVLLAGLVVLWLASAWWTWRDLAMRTRDPVAPYLAAGGVLLATPLFFPLALVVYRLVRPQDPAAVEEALALRQAAQAIAEPVAACPGCGRVADPSWRRCPTCGAELSVTCPACGQPAAIGWSICAWCAADLDPSKA